MKLTAISESRNLRRHTDAMRGKLVAAQVLSRKWISVGISEGIPGERSRHRTGVRIY